MLYAVTVNFTVTSVEVRQLCLKRIGVPSQKSLKTAGLGHRIHAIERFDSRPVRNPVTTLGKLFTLTYVPCRCKWSGGRVLGSRLCGYGSSLTAGHLQATLSKLLTCCVLRSTQPLTLTGTEMSSSLRATG